MHSLLNRRLRYLVKDDATVRRRVNAENVRQMPSDCFPLAVRITCQIDFIGIFCLFFERTNQVPFAAHIDVFRLKVMFHINAELTFRQIAQMSHRRTNGILFAEVPLDGLCLCRRLHNHQNFFLWFFSCRFRCLRFLHCAGFRLAGRCLRRQSVSSFRHADRRAFHSL